MKKLDLIQMEDVQGGRRITAGCAASIGGAVLATVGLAGIAAGTGGIGLLGGVAIAGKLLSYYSIYDSCK
ncbi:hypothetical protein CMT56_18855 [Elizabethkingia anophelis]|nr:hypothetical protein [Elizabethkingia anophelis]MDV3862893.1 hypothetical protein [Elizabethkingia anophelis]MDV3910566.1 hypothetical protein [Elizabethkingia anophelis]MDV3925389.1 hypothetical protein [Elizabethkingia anophelis]MDV3990069.1 hypothetical protein [Elizabethkingia anophelis]